MSANSSENGLENRQGQGEMERGARVKEKGQIHGRDAFIGQLAKQLGRKAPLTAPPSRTVTGVPEFYASLRPSRQEQIELFTRNWTALTGKVWVVSAAEAAEVIPALVRQVCAELQIDRVTRWEHPELQALPLDGALADAGIAVVPWRVDGADHAAHAQSAAGGDAGAAAERGALLGADAVAAVAPAAHADSVAASIAPAPATSPAAEPAPAPAREASADAADATALAAAVAPAPASEAAADAAAAASRWSTRSPLLQAAERCRLGVVWADYALANTGTLVLQAHGGRGRSVSLLPEALFAVFHADKLVTRMGEALERIREEHPDATSLPSSINLVTGPSRSADIENDLTIGIHGPGKVFAVIVQS